MVNFPGRNSRRRRVLNEEARSASGAHAARQSSTTSDSSSQAPRYSDVAGVENHPQITDFVPRRYRTIGVLVVCGVATAAMLGALHYFAQTVAVFAGLPTLRPLDLGAPGSLAAWFSAVVLFVASAGCLIVYSIRRHRIDDFKGRYRVWLGASAACLLLSANSVAGLHQVVAHSVSHFAGWTALRDGAVWWLAIAGLPLAWISLRAMLDVRECRLAATFVWAAAMCYATSAASFFGLVPATEPQNASLVTGATMLLGHWLVLACVVTYARYVILDAQGLIAARRPSSKKQTPKQEKQEKLKPATETKAAESKPTVLSVVNYARNKPTQTDADKDDYKWVDGRRPERKSYDSYEDEDEGDEGGSKLSKAERKRLRKLKAQNRAA
jgi:hypothetical protein